MKKIIIILIVLALLACSSSSKRIDTKEYRDTDEFITDQIFNYYGYELGSTPVERSLSCPDTQKFQKFDAYGYRIYLPWKIETKTIRNDYTSVVYSPGNFVLLFDNPYKNPISDMFMSILGKFEKYDEYRHVYKKYIHSKSNYDLVAASLNMNRESISPDSPLNEKIIAWGLLTIKKLYLFESNELEIIADPIFHFRTDKIKGYQIGDTIQDSWVRLTLFLNNNEELYLTLKMADTFAVTQSDIDYIIHNIEKIH